MEEEQAMRQVIATDLRRWEREGAAIPVSLVLATDEDTFAATIDISLSGMGVQTGLTLIPKQGAAIILKGQFAHAICACVVWAREEESGNSTLAGLKFLLH
jgi:hypothetical protein